MVIDTHLHEGVGGPFRLTVEKIIEQMNLHGVDRGIVSTVACCEYSSKESVFPDNPIRQVEANADLLDKLKPYEGRLYQSFWCKPSTETAPADVYDFIASHRDICVGMKWHPYYSRLALEDKKYEPYIEIARQLSLPVSVHTSADMLSNPGQLLSLAKKHPSVNFIMVHMGLCSDNSEAIECVGQADNLFGDTTWVPYENTVKCIERWGADKIMFGSDAPIDGDRSYSFYEKYLSDYAAHPDDNALSRTMYKNAAELFGIKL